MRKQHVLWMILTLVLAGILLVGCGPSGDVEGEGSGATVEQSENAGFPAKDPNAPFALDEKGTVTLTNDQAYTIKVQRSGDDPLFALAFKRSGVIDPSVDFTVQTIAFEMSEDLAEKYVPVGERALELHAVQDQGYGFALRPELKIHFTDHEIAAAQEAGAALETLKGSLLILYKEQRSPKWVPQISISVDESARVVTVSNIAASGAWMLAAKKAQ
jgi:hypothetical protein